MSAPNIPSPPFWAGWKTAAGIEEEWDERAAILEYEAEYSRAEAELLAYRQLEHKYCGVDW